MNTPRVIWTKGFDFIDGEPRYTFGDRDPQNSLDELQVVVYGVKEREYSHDSNTRRFYYTEVRHTPTETSDRLGRFKYLKDAKKEALKLFMEYQEKFN